MNTHTTKEIINFKKGCGDLRSKVFKLDVIKLIQIIQRDRDLYQLQSVFLCGGGTGIQSCSKHLEDREIHPLPELFLLTIFQKC